MRPLESWSAVRGDEGVEEEEGSALVSDVEVEAVEGVDGVEEADEAKRPSDRRKSAEPPVNS